MADHGSCTQNARCQSLVIEEDESYRVVMEACIGLTGCVVDAAPTPELAFPILDRRRFDLVVWGVPALFPGRRAEVIPELRLRTEAPLVVVDAGLDMAQIDLEAGADQWVPKPFAPGAFLGALRAALRTAASPTMDIASRIEMQGIVLDGRKRRLSFANREVGFTRQEWALLSILVSRPNRFLGVREIIRLGWRAGDHEPDQLRIYVRRLRLKMEPLSLPCRLISQHGQGYCLDFQAQGAGPASETEQLGPADVALGADDLFMPRT
jgi:DNA-binding response OmpR family regulator